MLLPVIILCSGEGADSFDLDGWKSRIFRALDLDYRQQIKGLQTLSQSKIQSQLGEQSK